MLERSSGVEATTARKRHSLRCHALGPEPGGADWLPARWYSVGAIIASLSSTIYVSETIPVGGAGRPGETPWMVRGVHRAFGSHGDASLRTRHGHDGPK